MILFKSPDQLMLTPAIGFVRDKYAVYFNLSWLWFGVAVIIWKIKDEQ